ncbi:MAG TPA: hypothetical protein VMB48_09965 [Steroidobacteraceae bacterium]|nr:hypothetical protein [Steroidobacteraceae bacterium]
MLAGRPVLELVEGTRSAGVYDLASGAALDAVSPSQAAIVAQSYLEPGASPDARAGPAAERTGTHTGRASSGLQASGLLEDDQWTLEGVSPGERPLYRFSLGDAQGTEIYVSRSTGRAVQLTTRSQRFWTWLGAVPHWLYFADLRRHALWWSRTVIYSSLIGSFLTAVGLYIGVCQLIRRPAGRWSPYRGFNLWHHLSGLVFGLFTLTWVLSGLLSMNPWGLLEGGGAGAERARLRGALIPLHEVRAALQALASTHPDGVVSIETAPLHGQLYLIASDAAGGRQRLDAGGAATPLSSAELEFIAAALGGGGGGGGGTRATAAADESAALRLLPRGDDYYFSHHGSAVRLPVYRVVAADGADTRYYIDPVSGGLLAKVDRAERGYRWWHQALHRMDFAAVLRARPQWDVLMWLLMSGVSTVCITGTYLGCRRLLR